MSLFSRNRGCEPVCAAGGACSSNECHENDVPCRGSVLYNLERYTVYLFGMAVEAGNARIALTLAEQIGQIRMHAQRLAHVCARREHLVELNSR